MKIINAEKWEVEEAGTKTLIFNNNQVGDTVASELYINPLDNVDIAVTAYVGPDDENGVALKCVDIANYEVKDAITEAGNYMFMVGSFYKVDIDATGTADVLIKYLY